MKKMVKVVSLACASAMLVSTTAFADGDAFKVGGIGPMTGGAAVYGQAVSIYDQNVHIIYLCELVSAASLLPRGQYSPY